MARIAAAARDAHIDARRGELLDAALRRIATQGFDGATVEAIAREAGVAKGTFYLYFDSKESLLAALIERHSLIPDLTRVVDALGEMPPEQAIPLIARAGWRGLRERLTLLRLVLREIPLREDNARLFMERVILPTNRLLERYLDGCVERGSIRALPTLVAGRAFFGMLVVFAITQEIFGGSDLVPMSDEEITETVAGLFLHGALARPNAAPGEDVQV